MHPQLGTDTEWLGSEAILKLLYNHIDMSGDLQARVKWQPGTVVLWDNRVTAHVSYTRTAWFPGLTSIRLPLLTLKSRMNAVMAHV